MAPSNRGGFRMGSVVMGGGLMDLLIRPVKCPGRPCLIGGGILIGIRHYSLRLCWLLLVHPKP